jgi:hypothetical protein
MSNFINATLVMLCLDLSAAVYGHSGLPPQFTLLRDSGTTSQVYRPRFLAASLGSELYIAVRGSITPVDLRTVLEVRPVTFPGTDQFVHYGPMMAARWVIDQCRDLISSWRGTITFTGHSLGGGASAIAATILRLRENYTNVCGVVFATAPALSEQLAARARSFVTTFIVDRDPVSRLSPLNMKRMVSAVVSINDTDTGMLVDTVEVLLGTILGTFRTGDKQSRGVREMSPVIAKTLIEGARLTHDQELVQPGFVCHVVTEKHQTEVRTFKEGRKLSSFTDVINEIGDHRFTNYQRVLRQSVSTLIGSRFAEYSQ